MNVWIITQAPYFNENYWVEAVTTTKKKAETYCRDGGYKWSTDDNSFINEHDQMYRNIEKHKVE